MSFTLEALNFDWPHIADGNRVWRSSPGRLAADKGTFSPVDAGAAAPSGNAHGPDGPTVPEAAAADAPADVSPPPVAAATAAAPEEEDAPAGEAEDAPAVDDDSPPMAPPVSIHGSATGTRRSHRGNAGTIERYVRPVFVGTGIGGAPRAARRQGRARPRGRGRGRCPLP